MTIRREIKYSIFLQSTYNETKKDFIDVTEQLLRMLHKSEAVNNICRNSCAILDVTLQFADIGLYNNFDINNGAERTRARHVQAIRAFATCGRYTRYVITLRRSINILDRWDKRGGEIFRRNRRDETRETQRRLPISLKLLHGKKHS